MSKTEIPPKGYKAFNISQPHIDHLGPGFYKKEDDDQLVLGFYVREEHLNGYGSAHGGMLMAPKVTPEIAEARGVPVYQDVISPSRHSEFSTPNELLTFAAILCITCIKRFPAQSNCGAWLA